MREAGIVYASADVLDMLGQIEHMDGRPDQATEPLGAADALRVRLHSPIWGPAAERHERLLDDLRALLGEDVFTELYARGQALAPATPKSSPRASPTGRRRGARGLAWPPWRPSRTSSTSSSATAARCAAAAAARRRRGAAALLPRLSERSLYLRFHGLPQLDERLVEPVLEPDWEERGALLGALMGDDGEEVVAVANYVRLRDPTVAEAAFAVADALPAARHRHAAARAARAARGVGRGRALRRGGDGGQPHMLGVFEAVGFELTRELAGGEIEVEFPLATTEAFETSVAERDHVAVTASVRPFFEPRSVAVIGASQRRGSIGGELFRNILRRRLRRRRLPGEPGRRPVAGRARLPVGRGDRRSGRPGRDLRPAAAVLGAAEQALRHGVRALVVISAGFAEIGSRGRERQEQLLALVRSYGARLIGPNCLGIAVAGPA